MSKDVQPLFVTSRENEETATVNGKVNLSCEQLSID